jgi:hypothetical protein
MPIAIVSIKFTTLNHDKVLQFEVIPNTGVMVTAIPTTHTRSLGLEVVLSNMAGQVLKILDAFEALIKW